MMQTQELIQYVKENSYEEAVVKFGISKWNIYKILKENRSLKVANKCLDDYKGVFTTQWACGRPMSKYKGAYPVGLMNRLANLINFDGKLILDLFSGTMEKNENHHTLDLDPTLNPTYVADTTKILPIEDYTYDVVRADPPYNVEKNGKNYSKELYGVKPVKPYSFVKEAVRILKPGGYLCILHHLVYIKPKRTIRKAVIGITSGPNMRIRTLNIFKKEGGE